MLLSPKCREYQGTGTPCARLRQRGKFKESGAGVTPLSGHGAWGAEPITDNTQSRTIRADANGLPWTTQGGGWATGWHTPPLTRGSPRHPEGGGGEARSFGPGQPHLVRRLPQGHDPGSQATLTSGGQQARGASRARACTSKEEHSSVTASPLQQPRVCVRLRQLVPTSQSSPAATSY